MSRPFPVLALVWLAVAGVCGVGCAMSQPGDTTPDLDPNLPGVEVGNDPKPAPGPTGGSAAKDAGGSSSSTPSGGDTDAGQKNGVAKDAGPAVDATPAIPKPSAGEVLVTEVMYATFAPEPAGEWIELHSLASAERVLTGLTLKDGSGRTHTIASTLTIAPGAYVVLARNKAQAITSKVPASAIVYEYGTGLPDNAGILLTNSSTGGISLMNGAATIAAAPYGGWYSQSGGSTVQLKVLDPSTTTSKTSWCLSLAPWTTGSEKGTPGGAEDCP